MQPLKTSPFILMLEDDTEDRYITESFFKENGYNVRLEFLTHGPEVMKYLHQCEDKGGGYPHLIILDKNVPTGSGMEVLRELKAHAHYKTIPVVMISGSAFPNEVSESYRLGVNSYILKPSTNQQTLKKIGTFFSYWFETVELPVVGQEEMLDRFQ
jgi:CheY-like chemotaxis protein